MRKFKFNDKLRLYLYHFFLLVWPSYMKGGNHQSFIIVLKHLIIQKVFRINSHVNWPVHISSKITAPERIIRGTRTPGLSFGCHIDGRNGIIFGRNVWVGPNVKIISMNHDPCDYNQYIKSPPVRIGDNCWIGSGAIILPSVVLGNHTIVGAGAVVTKSFQGEDQIVAGNPAKLIKKISPYKTQHDSA